MKRITMMLLVVGVLAAIAPAAEVEGFETTWTAAKKLAESQNKPLFLHFTTTWCGRCREIENNVYRKAEGKAALAPFVPASLDCTVPRGQAPTGDTKVHVELMQKYGGEGYPFLVMVTHDGVVLNKFSGTRPMAAFKAELAKALKANEEYRKLQEEAKTKAKTYEFNVRAMKAYAGFAQWDKAVAAAKTVRKLDPENKKGDRNEAISVLLGAAQANADVELAKELVGPIRKIDPGNEQHLLEKGLYAVAIAHLGKARNTWMSDREASKKHLHGTIAQLLEVTRLPNLTDEQAVWADVAQNYYRVGDKAKAVEAFEKALEVNPKSAVAPRIRRAISQLKENK